MGLLGEIYSFGNRTRNRLKGLLDDPKGYLQQTADQTANTLRDMTGANETAQQFALRDKINAGDKNALEQYRNLEKTIQNKLFDVALNFNPAAVGMTAKVAKEAPYAEAHRIAQRNAALPVEQGGLGLPANNTAMDRAKAMGFDMDVYHGSNNIDKITEFDPSKVVDNVQYGGKFYSSTDPNYASKYAQNALLGDSQGVIPLKMASGKRFDMSEQVSANDAANIMASLGQYERADKIRASGKPYRNGSELFYWGLDSSLPNNVKGDAILRSGFDSIHGDPKLEIVGEAGKPHSVVSDPSRLRSRFAAFDPMRRNEADLLGYATVPNMLGTAALGAGGMYGLGLLGGDK